MSWVFGTELVPKMGLVCNKKCVFLNLSKDGWLTHPLSAAILDATLTSSSSQIWILPLLFLNHLLPNFEFCPVLEARPGKKTGLKF